ncbi:MAG: tetratricopeptide repeat protein [Verrucomicrobiales bacterium]
MGNFEKCFGWCSVALAASALLLFGISPSFAAGEEKPQSGGVSAKSTLNPTGLQIGVNPLEAGTLPPGTEDLAKAGAMASADRDWEKAKKVYLDLLKKAPENALALSNLGAVEFRLGNLDAALDYLDRATRVAPGIAQNWLTIGLIQHDRGEAYLALSALARALNADPGDPRAHNYMGVVIRGLGWASGAETELQRAIALDPAYADAHFNLAVMYLDRSPPMLELARRHYYAAREYGAKPDEVIEQKLNPPPVPAVTVEPTEPAVAPVGKSVNLGSGNPATRPIKGGN